MVSHDLAAVTHLFQRLPVLLHGKAVETVGAADLAAHRVQTDCTRILMQAAVGFQRAAA